MSHEKQVDHRALRTHAALATSPFTLPDQPQVVDLEHALYATRTLLYRSFGCGSSPPKSPHQAAPRYHTCSLAVSFAGLLALLVDARASCCSAHTGLGAGFKGAGRLALGVATGVCRGAWGARPGTRRGFTCDMAPNTRLCFASSLSVEATPAWHCAHTHPRAWETMARRRGRFPRRSQGATNRIPEP